MPAVINLAPLIMKDQKNMLRVSVVCALTFLASAASAFANPAPLLVPFIHGFLLSSTAISAAATGAIAIAAANVIVAGAVLAPPTGQVRQHFRNAR
ncbi:hypothetical protein GFB56_09920 [Ensifer sp. T173]|uniref:Uncharacterized protein n=1 Tax=Ensifer canadensis TaxID=555315 RepID=A0AAW4FGD4_9HYPH|nr:hypothetical protein [Ensifer canadensis]MBM3091133.1 hypothetical protein [Ensifer canadensis]UBI75813.1 hypothetical protein J3R84_01235 [Ensifer canadensis]